MKYDYVRDQHEHRAKQFIWDAISDGREYSIRVISNCERTEKPGFRALLYEGGPTIEFRTYILVLLAHADAALVDDAVALESFEVDSKTHYLPDGRIFIREGGIPGYWVRYA